MDKKKAILLDFDGTLSDYSAREHLRTVDWDAYIAASVNDVPSVHVVEVLNRFKNDYKIIILSARGEKCREETTGWLDKFNVYYDKLILKGDNDRRDDCIIKAGLVKKIQKEYDIFFCIDDRPSCTKVFRDLGLYVFQCGEGY